ncbi:hypothetical protein BRARA_D00686 [Brassica rapa]|uniref:Uncharacterized protein n=1 Tax=Brassica campestris TaxID=3711 RepID=A0A397ZQZ7_BRACM|nr:hypothetical protein BRARA_D00686 [Brassica rapa]
MDCIVAVSAVENKKSLMSSSCSAIFLFSFMFPATREVCLPGLQFKPVTRAKSSMAYLIGFTANILQKSHILFVFICSVNR